MARYFLHIHNGNGTTRDEEGVDMDGIAGARLRAIEGIRSIISEEVLAGRIDLCGSVVIADEFGEDLLTVPFDQAFDICTTQGTRG